MQKGQEVRMKIIAGNSNPELAARISEHCFEVLVPANVNRFADGECSIELLENIRGEDVFVVLTHLIPLTTINGIDDTY